MSNTRVFVFKRVNGWQSSTIGIWIFLHGSVIVHCGRDNGKDTNFCFIGKVKRGGGVFNKWRQHVLEVSHRGEDGVRFFPHYFLEEGGFGRNGSESIQQVTRGHDTIQKPLWFRKLTFRWGKVSEMNAGRGSLMERSNGWHDVKLAGELKGGPKVINVN